MDGNCLEWMGKVYWLMKAMRNASSTIDEKHV